MQSWALALTGSYFLVLFIFKIMILAWKQDNLLDDLLIDLAGSRLILAYWP